MATTPTLYLGPNAYVNESEFNFGEINIASLQETDAAETEARVAAVNLLTDSLAAEAKSRCDADDV